MPRSQCLLVQIVLHLLQNFRRTLMDHSQVRFSEVNCFSKHCTKENNLLLSRNPFSYKIGGQLEFHFHKSDLLNFCAHVYQEWLGGLLTLNIHVCGMEIFFTTSLKNFKRWSYIVEFMLTYMYTHRFLIKTLRSLIPFEFHSLFAYLECQTLIIVSRHSLCSTGNLWFWLVLIITFYQLILLW